MTKEERAEKKRLREIEEERRKQEFPGVIFSFAPPTKPCTQIRLEAGDETRITLRKNKAAKWNEQLDYPEYETISVNLGEHIPGLLGLIHALVVRYNAIAKEINSDIMAIPRMEPLAIIEEPPEAPEVTA